MHFPHQLGKRDGKINCIGRSEHFGTFWATLMQIHFELLHSNYVPSLGGMKPKSKDRKNMLGDIKEKWIRLVFHRFSTPTNGFHGSLSLGEKILEHRGKNHEAKKKIFELKGQIP